jgi:hypothetical protein
MPSFRIPSSLPDPDKMIGSFCVGDERERYISKNKECHQEIFFEKKTGL